MRPSIYDADRASVKADDCVRILLVYLALCAGSILTVSLTMRRAEDAIPFSITGIIIFLYLFYIIDQLQLGYDILLGLIGAVYLFCVGFLLYRLTIRHDQDIVADALRRTVTPGMAIFTLLFFVLFAMTRFNVVSDWDSLRLWGAYPKALYYTNQLQLGNGALVYRIMQPYPPGLALFQYFVQRVNGTFVEANLFWAYGIFATAVFLPAIKTVRRENVWWVIVVAVLIFITPTTFSNSGFDGLFMYRSLYIDPMIGIVFAYCVFSGIKSAYSDVFSFTRFALGLMVLTILKDSGIFLAGMALLISVISKISKNRINARAVVTVLTTTLGVILVYGLWKITLAKHGVNGFYHMNFGSDFFDFGFAMEFLKKLAKTGIVNTPIAGLSIGGFGFSVALSIVLFAAIYAIVYRTVDVEQRGKAKKILVLVVISNVLYFAGMYITYVGIFAKAMPCFERYACAILQADYSLLVMCILNAGRAGLKKAWGHSQIIKAVATCSVIVCISIFPLNLKSWEMVEYNDSAMHANAIVSKMPIDPEESNDRKTSIYLAFNTDAYDIRHHRIYFNLLADNIYVELFSINVPIKRLAMDLADAAPANIEQIKREFVDYMVSTNCDYVYFVDDVPDAHVQMPEFFAQGSLKGDMYKAIFNADGTLSGFEKI